MSYVLRWVGLASCCIGASQVFAGEPTARAPIVVPVAENDWMTDVEQAGQPVAYAVVPLPAGSAGTLACVAVVLALRFSRHRRWVTLR